MPMVGAFARVLWWPHERVSVFGWTPAEVRALVSEQVLVYVGTRGRGRKRVRVQVQEWVKENGNASGRVMER
jgi:hypothetical protein